MMFNQVEKLPATSSSGARFNDRARRGIALREIVVIGCFAAILMMMLVMWLGRTRGDARRNLCQHRQQQTVAAIMQFEAVGGSYGGYKNLQAVDADANRQPTGSVFGLLPYLGYATPPVEEATAADWRDLAKGDFLHPYQQIYLEYGPDAADEKRGMTPQRLIGELNCPDDQDADTVEAFMRNENNLSWVVNTGMPDADSFGELPADWTANGLFENQFDEQAAAGPPISSRWLARHDGLENTLMLTENVDAGLWTDYDEALVGFVWTPESASDDSHAIQQPLRINELRGEGDGTVKFARPSSFHPGGVNAVYASGRTQFLSEAIDWRVYCHLMTSDGENAQFPGTEVPVPQ